MSGAVQRAGQDGAGAMFRYGGLSLAVGALSLALFLWFAFGAVAAGAARLVLGAGAAVQWVLFLMLFPSARRAVAAELAGGMAPRRAGGLFAAAGIAEAGWVLLFVGVLLAAFNTDILAPFGLPATAWLGIGLAGLLLPGVLVILTVLFAVKGASNA